MTNERDLSSDELDICRRSRNTTVVLTANGEVQTNEEAQVYVHDPDLFVTMQLLEEMPAVLSLGKLCEDHGYSYEWVCGPKPRLTKEEETIECNTDNFVPLVSKSSSTSTSQDWSSTSPAQERSDGLAPREWCGSPSKTQNKNTKRDGSRDADDRLRDLPEWLECLHPHTFLRTQIRNVLRKWDQIEGKHRIETHFPKDRNCEVCLRTKTTRAPCRRRTGEASLRAEKFGDLKTADHKVFYEEGESRDDHQYAVVVQDLATQWIQSYPCKTRTSQETGKSLRKFLEPSGKPKVIYTDTSLEFGKAREVLSWNHRTSTPHRSETNGIAERAARRVKEGTSAVLLQSGFDEKWWADSMECCCYLRNVQDLLAGGKSPYERRFGEPLKGSIIPFGAMVE